MPFLQQPIAIVDVETTGSKTQSGRIIEIGVLRIEGGQLKHEFHTLINPQQAIPFSITHLTGIKDDDVINAPTFDQISARLQEILKGCLIVAHNASFDYGFLKFEFKRLGVDFNATTLCSVKLSRRLFPEHQRHNLGALIERYGLNLVNRHRALDDAKVVWDFLQVLEKYVDAPKLLETWAQLTRQPVLPATLNIKSFDEIPEEPGIYIFYDKNDKVLYVGRAHHLREKIMGYFEDISKDSKRAQMLKHLVRVHWQVTCGDLGARLLSHHLVKTLKPVYNFPVRIPKDQIKPMRWPFNGSVTLEEKNPAGDESQLFIVHEWVLQKAMTIGNSGRSVFFTTDNKFDPALIKALHAFMKANPESVKVIKS